MTTANRQYRLFRGLPWPGRGLHGVGAADVTAEDSVHIPGGSSSGPSADLSEVAASSSRSRGRSMGWKLPAETAKRVAAAVGVEPPPPKTPLFVQPEDAHRSGQGGGILFRQRGAAPKPGSHRVDESTLARAEEGLVGKSSHYPSELLGSYSVTTVRAGVRVVRTSGLVRIKDIDIL